MSKRAKLLANVILLVILFMLALLSLLLYINYYPRIAVHLISDDELYDSIDVKKGGIIPVLPSPSKTGANFSGWYYDKEYDAPYDYSSTLNDDVELYAKYDLIDYTLTFYLDVNTPIYESRILNYNVLTRLPNGLEEITVNEETVVLNTYKTGHVFAGWSTSPASQVAEYPAGSWFEMDANNVDLYAVFKPQEFKVIYRTQGLTDNDYNFSDLYQDQNGNWILSYLDTNVTDITTCSYPYSYKIFMPENPVDAQGNFIFSGWFLDEEFTIPVDYTHTYMGINEFTYSTLEGIFEEEQYTRLYSNIVLFAKWTAVSYDIEFNFNLPVNTYITNLDSSILTTVNGVQTLKPVTNVYNRMPLVGIYEADLFENKVINRLSGKVSHAFGGWYATPEADGTKYDNGTVFNKSDVKDGKLTLYASWNEYYYINYVINSGRDRYIQKVLLSQKVKLLHISEFDAFKPTTGYTFSKWMNTSIYDENRSKTFDIDKEYTVTINSTGSNFITLIASTKEINLYPYNESNVYNINYDLSVIVKDAEGNYNQLNQNPTGRGVTFINTDGLEDSQKLQLNLGKTYSYNYGDNSISNQHVTLTASNDNTSYAKYVYNGTAYLLDKWVLVDTNNQVVKEIDGGTRLTFASNNDYVSNAVNVLDNFGKATKYYNVKLVGLWVKEVVITFAMPTGSQFGGTLPAPIKTMAGEYTVFHSREDINVTREFYEFMGWGYDGQQYDNANLNNKFYLKDGILYTNAQFTRETNFAPYGGTEIGGRLYESVTLYPVWNPYIYTLNVYNSDTKGNQASTPMLTLKVGVNDGIYLNTPYYGTIKMGYPILVGDKEEEKYFTLLETEGYSLSGWKLINGTILDINEVITLNFKVNDEYIFNPHPTTEEKVCSITAYYGLKAYDVTVNTDVEGVINGETKTTSDVMYGTLIKDFILNTSFTLNDQSGYVFKSWIIKVGNEQKEITNVNALTSYDIVKDNTVITLVTEIASYNVRVSYINPSVTPTTTLKTLSYVIKHGTTLSQHFDNLNSGEITFEVPADYEGYTLLGFKDNSENAYTLDEFNNLIIKKAISFVSEYQPKDVVVVYNSNLPNNASFTDTTYKYNQLLTLSEPTSVAEFKQEGYKLTGWSVNADGTNYVGDVGEQYLLTNSVNDYLVYNQAEDKMYLTLYAVWEELVSLSFYTPSGVTSSGLPAKMDFVVGTTLKISDVLVGEYTITKVGYKHNNKWIINGNENNVIGLNDNITLNVDTVLTPQFEPAPVTVTYKYYYSTDNSKQYVLSTTEFDFGATESVILPSTFESNVLNFGGRVYSPTKWQHNGKTYDLGYEFVIDETAITKNGGQEFEFIIMLEQEFSIIYRYNYESAPDGKLLTIINGNSYTIGDYNLRGQADLLTPERFGYNFKGWNTLSSGLGKTYNNGDLLTISERKDIILYAIWENKEVAINLNSNYPTSNSIVNEIDAEFGDTITLYKPSSFVCEGYRIMGWSTNQSATTATYTINQQLIIDFEQDVTLYAVWLKEYAVTYSSVYDQNQQPDSYSLSDKYVAGDQITLINLPNTFTLKTGYTFNGWKFDGQTYKPGESFTVYAFDGSIIEFEADWGINQIDINIYATQSDGSYSLLQSATVNYGQDFILTNLPQTVISVNGVENRLIGYSATENGTVAFESADGNLTLNSVEDSINLYTVYGKYYTLTYLAEDNVVLESTSLPENTVFGYANTETYNAFKSVSKVEHIHFGWQDEDGNVYTVLQQDQSGINYIAGALTSLILTKNVRLTPVFAKTYTVNIYKHISPVSSAEVNELSVLDSAGSYVHFTDLTTITAVEGDIISTKDYATDIYGWVLKTSNYVYAPTLSVEYSGTIQANDFVLTQQLCSTYDTFTLIPMVCVVVEFTTNASDITLAQTSQELVAGQTATAPTVSDTATKYFVGWVDESNTAFDFATKVYEDINITAIFNNFYSVSYEDENVENIELLTQEKLKLGAQITLAQVNNEVNSSNVDFEKAGYTLVGFKLVRGNQIFKDSFGKEVVFNPNYSFTLGTEFTLVDGTEYFDLTFVPVWLGNLTKITVSNANSELFNLVITQNGADTSITGSKTYDVVFGDGIIISNENNQLTLTFNAITNTETRETIETTVIASVIDGAFTLLNWKMGSTVLHNGDTINNQSPQIITFDYTAEEITVKLNIKLENSVVYNTDNGYFRIYDSVSGSYGDGEYEYTLSGSAGDVSLQAQAVALIETGYEFVGWYYGDDINSLELYSANALFNTTFNESINLYAVFSMGKLSFTHTAQNHITHTNSEAISLTDFDLLRVDLNSGLLSDGNTSYILKQDAVNNADNSYTIELERGLPLEFNVTYKSGKFVLDKVLFSYTLNDQEYLEEVVLSTSDFTTDASGNTVASVYYSTNEYFNREFVFVFRNASVVVDFYGYGANITNYASFTPVASLSVEYNAVLTDTVVSGVAIPADATDNGVLYTFNSWNINSNPITANTPIFSNFDTVHTVNISYKNNSGSTVQNSSSVLWINSSYASGTVTSINGNYTSVIQLPNATINNHIYLWKVSYTQNLTPKSFDVDLSELFTNNVTTLYDLFGNDNIDYGSVSIDAIYTPYYTINFYDSNSQLIESFTQKFVGDNITTPAQVTLSGYTFKAWELNGNEYNANQLVNITQELITNYAQNYTVDFYATYTTNRYALQFTSSDLNLGGIKNNGTQISYSNSSVYYVEFNSVVTITKVNNKTWTVSFNGAQQQDATLQAITLTFESDINDISGFNDLNTSPITSILNTTTIALNSAWLTSRVSQTEVSQYQIQFVAQAPVVVNYSTYAQEIVNGTLTSNYVKTENVATTIKLNNQALTSVNVDKGGNLTVSITENINYDLLKIEYVVNGSVVSTYNFNSADNNHTLEITRLTDNEVELKVYFNRKAFELSAQSISTSVSVFDTNYAIINVNQSEIELLDTQVKLIENGAYNTKSSFTIDVNDTYYKLGKVYYSTDNGATKTQFTSTGNNYYSESTDTYFVTHTTAIIIYIEILYKDINIKFMDYDGTTIAHNLTMTYNDTLTTANLIDLLENHKVNGNSDNQYRQIAWVYNSTHYLKTTSNHTTLVENLTTDVEIASYWEKEFVIKFADENGTLLTTTDSNGVYLTSNLLQGQRVLASESINMPIPSTSSNRANATFRGWELLLGSGTRTDADKLYIIKNGTNWQVVFKNITSDEVETINLGTQLGLNSILNAVITKGLTFETAILNDSVFTFNCVFDININISAQAGDIWFEELQSYYINQIDTSATSALIRYGSKVSSNSVKNADNSTTNYLIIEDLDGLNKIKVVITNIPVVPAYYFEAFKETYVLSGNTVENVITSTGLNLYVNDATLLMTTSDAPKKTITLNVPYAPYNTTAEMFDIQLKITVPSETSAGQISVENNKTLTVGTITTGSKVNLSTIWGTLLTYQQLTGLVLDVFVPASYVVEATLTCTDIDIYNNTCTLDSTLTSATLTYQVSTYNLVITTVIDEFGTVKADNSIIGVSYYAYIENNGTYTLSNIAIDFGEFDGKTITLHKTDIFKNGLKVIVSYDTTKYANYVKGYQHFGTLYDGYMEITQHPTNGDAAFILKRWIYKYSFTIPNAPKASGELIIESNTLLSDVVSYINENLSVQAVNLALSEYDEYNSKEFLGWDIEGINLQYSNGAVVAMQGKDIIKSNITISPIFEDVYIHDYVINNQVAYVNGGGYFSLNNIEESAVEGLGFYLSPQATDYYIISATERGTTSDGYTVYSSLKIKTTISETLVVGTNNKYFTYNKYDKTVSGNTITFTYSYANKTGSMQKIYGYYENDVFIEIPKSEYTIANADYNVGTVSAYGMSLARPEETDFEDNIFINDTSKSFYLVKPNSPTPAWYDENDNAIDLSLYFIDAFDNFGEEVITVKFAYVKVNKIALNIKDSQSNDVATYYYATGTTVNVSQLQNALIENGKLLNIKVLPTSATTAGSEYAYFADANGDKYGVRINGTTINSTLTDTTFTITSALTLTEIRVALYPVSFTIDNSVSDADLLDAGLNRTYFEKEFSFINGSSVYLTALQEKFNELSSINSYYWTINEFNVKGTKVTTNISVSSCTEVVVVIEKVIISDDIVVSAILPDYVSDEVTINDITISVNQDADILTSLPYVKSNGNWTLQNQNWNSTNVPGINNLEFKGYQISYTGATGKITLTYGLTAQTITVYGESNFNTYVFSVLPSEVPHLFYNTADRMMYSDLKINAIFVPKNYTLSVEHDGLFAGYEYASGIVVSVKSSLYNSTAQTLSVITDSIELPAYSEFKITVTDNRSELEKARYTYTGVVNNSSQVDTTVTHKITGNLQYLITFEQNEKMLNIAINSAGVLEYKTPTDTEYNIMSLTSSNTLKLSIVPNCLVVAYAPATTSYGTTFRVYFATEINQISNDLNNYLFEFKVKKEGIIVNSYNIASSTVNEADLQGNTYTEKSTQCYALLLTTDKLVSNNYNFVANVEKEKVLHNVQFIAKLTDESYAEDITSVFETFTVSTIIIGQSYYINPFDSAFSFKSDCNWVSDSNKSAFTFMGGSMINNPGNFEFTIKDDYPDTFRLTSETNDTTVYTIYVMFELVYSSQTLNIQLINNSGISTFDVADTDITGTGITKNNNVITVNLSNLHNTKVIAVEDATTLKVYNKTPNGTDKLLITLNKASYIDIDKVNSENFTFNLTQTIELDMSAVMTLYAKVATQTVTLRLIDAMSDEGYNVYVNNGTLGTLSIAMQGRIDWQIDVNNYLAQLPLEDTAWDAPIVDISANSYNVSYYDLNSSIYGLVNRADYLDLKAFYTNVLKSYYGLEVANNNAITVTSNQTANKSWIFSTKVYNHTNVCKYVYTGIYNNDSAVTSINFAEDNTYNLEFNNIVNLTSGLTVTPMVQSFDASNTNLADTSFKVGNVTDDNELDTTKPYKTIYDKNTSINLNFKFRHASAQHLNFGWVITGGFQTDTAQYSLYIGLAYLNGDIYNYTNNPQTTDFVIGSTARFTAFTNAITYSRQIYLLIKFDIYAYGFTYINGQTGDSYLYYENISNQNTITLGGTAVTSELDHRNKYDICWWSTVNPETASEITAENIYYNNNVYSLPANRTFYAMWGVAGQTDQYSYITQNFDVTTSSTSTDLNKLGKIINATPIVDSPSGSEIIFPEWNIVINSDGTIVKYVKFTVVEGGVSGYEYTYNSDGILTKGTEADVNISNNLKTIVISNYITDLGHCDNKYVERCFSHLYNLNTITYDGENMGIVDLSKITKIGANALSHTNVSKVILNADVELASSGQFYYCQSLTTVGYCKDGITTIKDNLVDLSFTNVYTGFMFAHCSAITTVKLASNVEEINISLFGFCTSISSVYDETITDPQPNTLYVPKSVKLLGYSCFQYIDGIITVDFQNNENLDFGQIIEDSVMEYGYDSFAYCSNLQKVINTSKITSLLGARRMFYSTKLTQFGNTEGIVDLSNITHVGEYTFGNTDITHVRNTGEIVSLGIGAFYGCESLVQFGDLQNIIDLTNLTVVENEVFAYCDSIIAVKIAEQLNKLGNDSFISCDNLVSMYYDDSQIGDNTIHIEYVKTIGSSVFRFDSSIVNVSCADSYIGTNRNDEEINGYLSYRLFSECSKLEYVSGLKNIHTVGSYAFLFVGTRTNNDTRVPGLENITKLESSAFDYSDIKQVGPAFTGIGASGTTYTFESINLSKVTYIGAGAFDRSDKFTNVLTNKDLSYIGSSAFTTTNGSALKVFSYDIVDHMLAESVNGYGIIRIYDDGTHSDYYIGDYAFSQFEDGSDGSIIEQTWFDSIDVYLEEYTPNSMVKYLVYEAPNTTQGYTFDPTSSKTFKYAYINGLKVYAVSPNLQEDMDFWQYWQQDGGNTGNANYDFDYRTSASVSLVRGEFDGNGNLICYYPEGYSYSDT